MRTQSIFFAIFFSFTFLFVNDAQGVLYRIDQPPVASDFSYHDVAIEVFKNIPGYFEKRAQKESGEPCTSTNTLTSECATVGLIEFVISALMILVGSLLLFSFFLKLIRGNRFKNQAKKRLVLTLWAIFLLSAVTVDLIIESLIVYTGIFVVFYILLFSTILSLHKTV